MATSDDDKMIQSIIANALSGAGGGTASSSTGLSSGSPIYLGAPVKRAIPSGGTKVPFAGPQPYQATTRTVQDAIPYGQARLAPRDWSSTQLKEFVNKGIVNKMPGFDVHMGLPEIMQAWDNLLQQSYSLNEGLSESQKKWTPSDIMNTYSNTKNKFGTVTKDGWVWDVATGERIKYAGPKSKTVTSKHIDLSSPEEAQALVSQVLHQALGRNPTESELARFKSTISGYEKEHPETTTTTQQLTPNLETGEVNVTSESSTTTGGVSDAARAALVNAPVTKTQEYGKYQSA